MNKARILFALALGIAGAFSAGAQVSVPSAFKHITIDGSFDDWTGVPLAYTAAAGSTSAIQYENVYVANDQNNLYLRFTLYAPRSNAFANSFDNIFIDTDNNAGTGFYDAGIGSELLIQWGGGYQEASGVFNAGTVSHLGWQIAGSPDGTDFEVAISLSATNNSDNSPVFPNSSIAILLEGDDSSYTPTEFAPSSGGLVYTFAAAPSVLTTNLPLVTLANSSWQVNEAGADLGTNWLDSAYDDTQSPWISGTGLFGYTPAPGVYPAINTPLTSTGQNTYYFRTHFTWNNLPDNLAFVMTNYLSDGAVYYVNGVEVNRLRMPAGAVSFATSASTTNSPAGHADILGVPAGVVQLGDNILEVETHQAPASSADMVFGLSLTADAQLPIVNLDATQPADRAVVAGNPTTFAANLLASGPLSYQWMKGGNPITGATNATYTIPTVIYTDAGTYSLQTINSVSTNTTRAATLTVSNIPVSIADVTLPGDVVAVAGQSMTLSSSVAGSPPISYQWYFGTSAIAGATNATYVVPFLVSSNAGAYHYAASNPANSTNSRSASVVVLADTLAPVITHIAASSTQVVVSFSKPVDPTSASVTANYSISGPVPVASATVNSNDATQVILTTATGMSLQTAYILSINGVKDLFGNTVTESGGFVRSITIDGAFDDWTGIAPVYSGSSLSANLAADFENIYVYNDADNYYFRVTLWHDIDPAYGQFPAYANLYFDTDNNPGTGFSSSYTGPFGSELLCESGSGYQQKNGGFNEGGINGLGWVCLPASPGTNFEFSISRSATYANDGLPIFTTNIVNFHFEGQTASWAAVNEVPASGGLSYTNVVLPATSLPLGRLAVSSLSASKVAVIWNSPGTLQMSGSLTNGVWTNAPSATSPYVPVGSTGQMFFRLVR